MKRYFLIIGFLGIFPISGSAADAYVKEACTATIKFYDNLQTCTPSTFSYRVPFLDFPFQETIHGNKGDKCLVTYVGAPGFERVCELSKQTIKYMTTEKKYQEMRACRRSANSSSSPSSSEDPVFAGQAKECKNVFKGRGQSNSMSINPEPDPTVKTTGSQPEPTPAVAPTPVPANPAVPADPRNFYKDYPSMQSR
jgi:hypothetical protein